MSDTPTVTYLQLKERVEAVLASAGDPEMAHFYEDELMVDWIAAHASPPALAQFERMWDGDFPRWCA